MTDPVQTSAWSTSKPVDAAASAEVGGLKVTNVSFARIPGNRGTVLVRVDICSGLYGLGEAKLPGPMDDNAEVFRRVRSVVLATDCFRTDWMLRSRDWSDTEEPALSLVLAGVDQALWDLRGKHLGVPTYQLFGGQTRKRVRGVRRVPFDDLSRVFSTVDDYVSDGWTAFILDAAAPEASPEGTPDHLEHAVEAFSGLREVYGDEIEFALDANRGHQPSDAKRLCRALEPYRPLFVLDPFPAEVPDLYTMLRNDTGMPLAASAHLMDASVFRLMIEANLIDYARFDPSVAGGLTETRKLAALCEAHMVDIVAAAPSSPVGEAAALTLSISAQNVLLQEAPLSCGEGCTVESGHNWQSGWLVPSEGPGLGVSLSSEVSFPSP